MLPSILAQPARAVPRHDPVAADQPRRRVAVRGAHLRRAGAADHPRARAQGDAHEPRRPADEPAAAPRPDAEPALRPLQERRDPAQQAYIDSLVTSQQQVRNINQNLLDSLASIKDNSAASQILAAVTLIQMKVTPVIAIHIPFGGDNHRDIGLANETAQTVSGVATIASLMQQLAARGPAGSGHVHVAQRVRPHDRREQHRRAAAQPEPPGVASRSASRSRAASSAASARSRTTTARSRSTEERQGRPRRRHPADELARVVRPTMLAAVGVDPAVISGQILSGTVVNAALTSPMT